MGRPVALDDVQSMTIGQVKALEGSDDPADAAAAEAEESAAAEASGAKPMVRNCTKLSMLQIRAMSCSALDGLGQLAVLQSFLSCQHPKHWHCCPLPAPQSRQPHSAAS